MVWEVNVEVRGSRVWVMKMTVLLQQYKFYSEETRECQHR